MTGLVCGLEVVATPSLTPKDMYARQTSREMNVVIRDQIP